ncbi:MAG: efflux RND transporter periplasmic adaptor subunit [Candidatus Zambryskibacteria bacterium]|nr:efflux RND transporter periplasmic adaptor subunit [Candidatus Zambryskibacteria bacterium]
MKYSTFIARVKVFFTRKKIIWTVVIMLVLFGIYFIFGKKNVTGNIQTDTVKVQDIKKTVLTTGQVVSVVDLNLSFQTGGVVKQINVKEGDVVKIWQTLAVLDQGTALANLKIAQGALAQAQANYNKILAAATSQDIAVSQAAVDVAQTTLSNAKQNLLNQLSTAYNNANTVVLSDTNNLFSNPQSPFPQFSVNGTTQTNQQLVSDINNERGQINSIFSVWQTELSTATENNVDKIVTDSLSNLSIISNYLTNVINVLTGYTQITSGGSQTTLTAYQSAVVSGKATIDGLSTTITTYNQAVKSAQASLDQAKATLSLKQAPTRPEDVDIAKAQVLSAQGQADSAGVTLNNTVLRAPASGTITQVDIKLGEQAQATKEVMMLKNIGELHAEALVSEADIASVAVGQSIDNTFDALGPLEHFTSKVLVVNPASTIVSGVVNYKVVGSLENIPNIKPGMTINMTILVAEKKGALVVPSSAIVNRDNKQYVKVIDDLKKQTYHEVEVKVGLEADSGLTEIISGLAEGQEIITYMK